ncbi:hypothetical protein BpHYR1_051024 [Brachionus plicatilis]|uniref:Uncharacterized protein n=1 Tax=Brachionus plicatilis TaxID=10195 RepID=A0A3M7SQQ3_BRAPC|nr:hypothetical protein BpHYR1_051024 [Brachionus plicatilis]
MKWLKRCYLCVTNDKTIRHRLTIILICQAIQGSPYTSINKAQTNRLSSNRPSNRSRQVPKMQSFVSATK